MIATATKPAARDPGVRHQSPSPRFSAAATAREPAKPTPPPRILAAVAGASWRRDCADAIPRTIMHCSSSVRWADANHEGLGCGLDDAAGAGDPRRGRELRL